MLHDGIDAVSTSGDTLLHNRNEYCVITTAKREGAELLSVYPARWNGEASGCGTPIRLSGKMERRSVRVRNSYLSIGQYGTAKREGA